MKRIRTMAEIVKSLDDRLFETLTPKQREKYKKAWDNYFKERDLIQEYAHKGMLAEAKKIERRLKRKK